MQLILNGEPHSAEPGVKLKELLDELGLPEKGLAVERNLEIVPKSSYAQVTLQDGDRLEIIQFVGGG